MNQLPKDIEEQVLIAAQSIQGWLTPREMRFLSIVTLNPVAVGRVVEIGFYQGKSTSVIAASIGHTGSSKLVTVDPIDPAPLHNNLARLDLGEFVDVRNQCSSDFVADWDEPIRFLWHDGANDIATVRQDCECLFPYLSDRAIVAFHDVLNTSGERIHVFDELILKSASFGWTGVCGSIGFGQYHYQPIKSAELQTKKQRLSQRLGVLKPWHCASSPKPKGFNHIVYRVLRSRIPHGPVFEVGAA